MQRLNGKWVVLVGDESALGQEDVAQMSQVIADFLAAQPAGLVVTALRGKMTEAFIRGVRAVDRTLPIVAVNFGHNFTPVTARGVTQWVDYTYVGDTNAWDAKQCALDGHAVAVARMKGSPGILAFSRANDLRERNCRPMALAWNIMVVVRKDAAPLPMPF